MIEKITSTSTSSIAVNPERTRTTSRHITR
jgi:hypothetical protein